MSHSQFRQVHLNLLHFVDFKISQAFQITENLLPRQSFKRKSLSWTFIFTSIKKPIKLKKIYITSCMSLKLLLNEEKKTVMIYIHSSPPFLSDKGCFSTSYNQKMEHKLHRTIWINRHSYLDIHSEYRLAYLSKCWMLTMTQR